MLALTDARGRWVCAWVVCSSAVGGRGLSASYTMYSCFPLLTSNALCPPPAPPAYRCVPGDACLPSLSMATLAGTNLHFLTPSYPPANLLTRPHRSIRAAQRLDTLHPLLRFDDRAFVGSYAPIPGTHLLFDAARLPRPGTPAATAAAAVAAATTTAAASAAPATALARAALVGTCTQRVVFTPVPLDVWDTAAAADAAEAAAAAAAAAAPVVAADTAPDAIAGAAAAAAADATTLFGVGAARTAVSIRTTGEGE